MSFVTENITPIKAQEYLATSRGNRPLSKVSIRSYADTMKKGGWILNGIPIVFDNEGHLLDGHHRLEAVILAGIPVRFDVYRGVSPDAFTTYDCGRHRTVAQLLAMQGVKHYTTVGSIIIANDRLVRSGRLYESNTSPDALRKSNAERYLDFREDEKGWNEAAAYIVKLEKRCRILSSSWAGGLYYYLTHSGGYSHEEVAPFFEALFSLDTSDIPVVNLLRKAITKEAVEGRRLMAETLWAFIVKTWNAYITNTSPKILRYTEKEGMPSLILKN